MFRYREELQPIESAEDAPLLSRACGYDHTSGYSLLGIHIRAPAKKLPWVLFVASVALASLLIIGLVEVLAKNDPAPLNSPASNDPLLKLSLTNEDASRTGSASNVPNGSLKQKNSQGKNSAGSTSSSSRIEKDFQTLLSASWPLPDTKSRLKAVKPVTTFNILKSSSEDSRPKRTISSAQVAEGLAAGDEALVRRTELEIRLKELGLVPKRESATSGTLSFRKPSSPRSLAMSSAGFKMEKAYLSIATKLNLNKTEAEIGLLFVNGSGTTQLNDFCPQPDPVCNFTDIYRPPDGSCNNKKHPLWGASFQSYRRILDPDYEDGISMMRSKAMDGSPIPNPKVLSMALHPDEYREDPKVTMMFPLFGQLIDHDVTAASNPVGINGTLFLCCNPDGTLLDQTLVHPECIPIYLLKDVDGEYYERAGNEQRCMTVLRGSAFPNCEFGPREQYNELTSFIDGSIIYGSSFNETRKLRVKKFGRLRASYSPDGRAMLMINPNIYDRCYVKEEYDMHRYCFISGDIRTNERLTLTAMHTIWMRQHNLITDALVSMNPDWDDEKVFQEARRILGAQLQHITYNEFVPTLFGPEISDKAGLTLEKSGYYKGYDENIDSTISNVFAGAAFRFGHSMIQGLMRMIGPMGKNVEFVQLHKTFFAPFRLWTEGQMDQAIRGSCTAPAAKVDTYFTNQLSEHLFQGRNDSHGHDLVAINIHRGRDHGFPTYPHWRKVCGFAEPQNFTEMEGIWDEGVLEHISTMYKVIEDVDLYPGLLAEKPIPGAIIGPTLTCLLADQFVRLRKGDRFWYEGTTQPKQFTPAQLASLRKTTLARVLCENGDDLKGIQLRAMLQITAENPIIPCVSSQIPFFDYSPWKEKSKKSDKNAPLINTNILAQSAPSDGPDSTKTNNTEADAEFKDLYDEQWSKDSGEVKDKNEENSE